MENPGLGTLSKLPREIRDMIFDLSFSNDGFAFPLYSGLIPVTIKEAEFTVSQKVPLAMRRRGRRQFYREYLEAHLRRTTIICGGRTVDVGNLEYILICLGQIANVASHTRKIILQADTKISSRNCYTHHEFLIRYAVMLKTFNRCVARFGIPPSRLSIRVRYVDITQELNGFIREMTMAYAWGTHRLRSCGLKIHDYTIEVVMGDEVQSIQNMEQCCRDMEKAAVDHIRSVLRPSTAASRYLVAPGIIESIIERGKAVVQDTFTRVKEKHLPLIEVATRYWTNRDRQELEDACRRLRWKERQASND
ncbi:uncharacterized protein M437DRAFT_66880 [Aureobasidium melanogenum CBS 110374]|uniref:Uncharacterized protein n=1 Tax=Aureobasidium melanogenum (strain CBS 110374) TaxID=1043003 RepID=A0A074VRS4_AURM1|nr:uncharacterized protein M437DRAFT_66880 [Aureobasidium melanogenum CBS 110374]KEQ61934.1 hypothetical protein M437DRAFT_66880 [Aureobasidium melanogenum CBS 110374]